MMEADPHIEPDLRERPPVDDEREPDEPVAATPPAVMDHAQLLRLLEAMLFAAAEPLTLDAIAARMPKSADLKALLNDLEALYVDRGVNVGHVAGKGTPRTAPDRGDALKSQRT